METPNKTLSLLEPRIVNHGFLSIPNGIWLLGGAQNSQTSTEFIYLNGTSNKGPDLPVQTRYHCVTKLNETAALLSGGYTQNKTSDETYIYNFVTRRWSMGPRMQESRFHHGCGQFYSEYDESNMVMSIGGKNFDGCLNSVEYLLESSSTWKKGTYAHNIIDRP